MQFKLKQSAQGYSLKLTFFPTPMSPLIDFTGYIKDDSVSVTPHGSPGNMENNRC